MALPSHRTSSPSMVAGRTSPSSRNSEIGSPIRRSFSGNPFPKPSIVAIPRSLNPTTPANSPSDYPGRSSTSIENLYTHRDNEEKENEKDQSLKPLQYRSPTIGKSTKNFMSPTISAASKFIASPKKKILSDRNDQVRWSLSFSSSKCPSLNSVNQNLEASIPLESDSNPQIALISTSKSSKNVRFGGVEVISCSNDDPEMIMMADETDSKLEIAPVSKSAIETVPPITVKTLEFVDGEGISISSTNDLESKVKSDFTEDIDCVNLDPSFKISPVSSPIEVSSLDTDPSIAPPYDPKTNYLSPRPQFLHYKPRKINQQELDGRLEELFSSTIVPEYEFTEEIDSKDPQMECDEAGNELQVEEEEQREEEEEITDVSEQIPVGAENSSKLQFSRMFKISSLLLILFTACFSICVVNVYHPNILERSSLLTMEDSTGIFEFSRINFNLMVRKLEIWHENSRSFVSDMILNIRGRPLIYFNQTEFFLKDVVNPIGQCTLISRQTLGEQDSIRSVIEEDTMKEKEIDTFEDHSEERKDSLLEAEAINVKLVERDAQNEEEQLFYKLEEAMAEIETDIYEESTEKVHNEEEQESLQEIEAVKEVKIKAEHIERDAQNEEEEEELFHEIEDKANYPKDIEESLQEIIEDSSAISFSDELSEEDHIHDKQTEEDYYEVSSSPNSKIHDQFEQEPAALGETEDKQTDSIQQINTEPQTQSPPISPPPGPQSDVENENGRNIHLNEAAADDKLSRDFSQNIAIIISAILLGLTLLAGRIYTRKSSSRPPMAAIATTKEQNEQSLQKEKKTNHNPMMVQEEVEPIDDDDNDDQSCSYETSSFQYSSMREDKPEAAKRSSEAQSHSRQSHGRKISRRESMASSSLDESVSISTSPSYGSFTTYEKFPIKHGDGEEEIVTPVRRSSRIRKAAQT